MTRPSSDVGEVCMCAYSDDRDYPVGAVGAGGGSCSGDDHDRSSFRCFFASIFPCVIFCRRAGVRGPKWRRREWDRRRYRASGRWAVDW